MKSSKSVKPKTTAQLFGKSKDSHVLVRIEMQSGFYFYRVTGMKSIFGKVSRTGYIGAVLTSHDEEVGYQEIDRGSQSETETAMSMEFEKSIQDPWMLNNASKHNRATCRVVRGLTKALVSPTRLKVVKSHGFNESKFRPRRVVVKRGDFNPANLNRNKVPA